MAFVFRQKKPIGLMLGVVGFFCLGAGRFEAAAINIDPGHIAYYNGREEVIVTGLVADESEVHDRVTLLRLQSESVELPGTAQFPVEGDVQIVVPRYPDIPYGARLRLSGPLTTPDEDLDFDYRAYLARQGIYSQMVWPDIVVLEEGRGNWLYHAIYEVKGKAQSTINRILPDPQAALLSGILLGNEDQIPPALEEQFRISGLSHIIAISGFNIAILAVILLRGSQPFVGRRWSAWVALGGVAIYTVLVGAEASVVRAAIMAAIFIFATRFMGRPTFAPAGLFTAAMVMTLANPHILWEVGFQLSFAATLGLMIYFNPWKSWLESGIQKFAFPVPAKQLASFLGDVLLATLAAMLLTMPLVIYHFQQLSVVSPLANFFTLPAQPGVMSWGIISTITGMVFPAAGELVAWTVWPFLTYTISSARFFASMQSASVPAAISTSGLLAIYALIFGVTWLGWKGRDRRVEVLSRVGGRTVRRVGLTLSAIMAVIAVTMAFTQPDGNLHISFFDVGQGDATLIQTPGGRSILVDGGLYPSVLNDQIGRAIPFWERKIDLVIATHPDDDHVAGLPSVLERYDVGQLITNGQAAEEESYQALLDIAAENAVPIHQARAGEIIEIGDGVRLEILNPPSDQRPPTGDHHDNDLSVAFRLTYGDFSLLLTGDAGAAAEREMLASGQPLSAVVYKAGHHGAKSSSGESFLGAVQPRYVIVSAGEGNNYGHPHPEVLARAAAGGAQVLRTDELGTIEVVTDGEQMWWESHQ